MAKKKMMRKKKTVRRRPTTSTKKNGDMKHGSTEGKFYYAVKKVKSYKTKDGDYVKSHERTIALSWRTVAVLAAGYLVSRWIRRQVKANTQDIAGLTRNQAKMSQTMGKIEMALSKQQSVLEKIIHSQGFQNYAKARGYESVAETPTLAQKLAYMPGPESPMHA